MNTSGAGQGWQEATDRVMEETSDRGRTVLGQLGGGRRSRQLVGRSGSATRRSAPGQQKTWWYTGVCRPLTVYHLSAVVPGCEKMGGREISCPGPLPTSPQTTKTQALFFDSSLFIQAIDEIDLSNQFINRLKKCVTDPLDGIPNRRVSPKPTKEKIEERSP